MKQVGLRANQKNVKIPLKVGSIGADDGQTAETEKDSHSTPFGNRT